MHRPPLIWSLLFSLVGLLLSAMPGWTEEHTVELEYPQYRRPGDSPYQSRSVVMSREGMVATSQPLAAQVGLEILRHGGTAADAAIATNAMLGLVEPMSCGIGGDLFVIYWDAKNQKLYGLNASGRSPQALSRKMLVEEGHEYIPTYGPLSWSVPGCVSGWGELHERFGQLDWETILMPSVEYAERGFPVTEVIAAYWKGSEERLKEWPTSQATYLPDERAPRAGEVFANPDLAAVYRAIAKKGPEVFYQGWVAERIVEFSQHHEGFLRLEDFAAHQSEWVEPVSTNYRGYDVWELPPNGQGIAALQVLNLLEPYDLKAWGPGHPDYLHLFVEAKKLAFADRARFYADPTFEDLPVQTLISKAYARQRGKRIDMQQAATNIPPGDPLLAHGDTIYLTVVDKDRNCCSFIQSIFHGFGSGIVPGKVGFALQNRGALFSLQADHPNRFEPSKRPFHTIIPAMVTKDGKPWLCFGVMGGDMQPQGHAQILVNLIDFGMNVQAAGDTPRVRHNGSAEPTGRPEAEHGGTVLIEPGIPATVRAELESRGHQVKVAGGSSFGGYQAILIDEETGMLHGATEPRKDGTAVGY